MISISEDQSVYIVSLPSPLANALQTTFSEKGISTHVVEMERALVTDLDNPAGIIIIAPDSKSPGIDTIIDVSNNDNALSTNTHTENRSLPGEKFKISPQASQITIPRYAASKQFLKNAFLLAGRNGIHLTRHDETFEKKTRQSSTKEERSGAFFATLSFLGGSFGFGDEAIVSPLQGGLAGLTKTAQLEWPNVCCRAIDLPPDEAHAIAHAEEIVTLMLTRRDIEQGNVEVGLKKRCCIFPQLIEQALDTPTAPPMEKLDDCFDASDPSATPIHQTLTPDDVVLITGGAKGVTAQCAIELAKAVSPTIVLMGRSPMPEPEPHWMVHLTTEAEIKKGILTHLFKDTPPPTPMELQKYCNRLTGAREIHQTLERIQLAGATVSYRSVDIRDPEAVAQSIDEIRQTVGPITAIIHGAGVLKDKLIAEKTEAQFTDVFETKVDGMVNILSSTWEDPLKCVVFFSSVAARYGNSGQVDYAMANEVLNKTAQYYSYNGHVRQPETTKHQRTRTADRELFHIKPSSKENDLPKNDAQNPCRFISINWGPWEGGMVTPQLKRAFLERGIDLIPLDAGAKAFVSEICQGGESTGKTEKERKKSVVSGNRVHPVEVVMGASLLANNAADEPTETFLEEKSSVKPVETLFDRDQLLAFSIGNPSEAFGARYKAFDTDREIARLPGPPYFFMDRITKTDAPQWEMKPSGWIEAQFDLPNDGWYFRAGYTDYVPFCILLEIALQPCGWLAAYAGSALKSNDRLHFRNLGGEAKLIRPVHRNMGTLTMRSRMTSVSHAGGLIIQDFDLEVLKEEAPIYRGKTNFGFFTKASLANQTGIRQSPLHGFEPSHNDWDENRSSTDGDSTPSSDMSDFSNNSGNDVWKYPVSFQNDRPITPDDLSIEKEKPGMPSKALRMIDTIDIMIPDGGKYGKGYIQGSKAVDPDEWFFKAHFYQDPVCPGSLGVESFLQLMQFFALKVWAYDPEKYEIIMPQHVHKWIYRGQIVPANKRIKIITHIKSLTPSNAEDQLNGAAITADGLLYVDGLCIYQMEDFQLHLVPVSQNRSV